MNLYVLLGITSIFVLANFIISEKDIVNPSFIFCGMNFLYIVICCINHNIYKMDVSGYTVIVISLGMLIFTISNVVFHGMNRKSQGGVKYLCTEVRVNIYFVILIYFIMIFTAFIMTKHIIEISREYGGGGNLITSIGIYDNITKFSNESIRTPVLYSVMSPVIKATAYIFAAILVNNYFGSNKLNVFLLIYCISYCLFALMGGSRSELVRYLMAVLIDTIIIRRKIIGTYKKGNLKTLFRIIIFAITIVLVSFPLLNVIGKTSTLQNNAPLLLLYKYIGGPIYNLDTALTKGFTRSSLWGQESFQGVYNFLAHLLHDNRLNYRLNLPTSYINGIDLGNVYTMYFMFFEDFGYKGILLVIPICLYYFASYKKLVNYSTGRSPLSINLFVYSYMFNALVMLLFSNRFYENMFSYSFFKLFVSFNVIWFFISRIRIKEFRSNRNKVF